MSALTNGLLGVAWFVPIGIYIILSYVVMALLRKHLANQPDQIKRLFINFSLCTAFAVLFAATTNNLVFVPFVFAIGMMNGVANIVHWRANRISMSKTSLLSFGDDVIAILLAIVFVGDGSYLNWVNGTGMTLCLLTGVLFWQHHFKGREPNRFFLNVLTYSVLWGMCDFALRFYAKQELPVPQLLLGWYSGAWFTIGCTFFYRLFREKKQEPFLAAFRLPWGQVAILCVFAVGIMTSVSVEYWARMLAPQTVVQPILLIAEAVVPTVAGIIVFKEKGSFDRAEWCFAALGILGTILVAVGFHG
jgi:hypothetical protein